MGEGGDLLLHPLDDAGVGVADVHHRDARAEVDQRVAVDVDDHAAARALDVDRQGAADAGRDGGGASGVQARASAAPAPR
ncbi:hypothetical protein GCM10025868_08030 [Angustibacter aerolatus]|uniref:Uncharacterized protein n=1 Tax=Angustibacter aerolatus TaxID=1162965 RepID=A0ABQ6JBL1_9ACTN|nr:hypothetical protein GCM10025868_08030 [Angustibacter aerolatus]